MTSRCAVLLASAVATASSFFTLGVIHSQRGEAAVRAAYDARIDELREELRHKLGHVDRAADVPAGTSGRVVDANPEATEAATRDRLMSEIKLQLQNEMGLLPVHLLRDRRASFVELYADDNFGKTNYGTAGYLGNGYFVTVKHAVVALKDEDNRQGARKVLSIKVMYKGRQIPAKLVDAGNAEVEVDNGDWAIIKTRDLDLPPLKVDSGFGYEFADPIFRLGNDYSKGIVVSTGYVGQKTTGGLVTCLTDGHPGVSGGGVLNQRGDLVGIPIGRMQGDYRFSFILPIRKEMLRKVPAYQSSEPNSLAAVQLNAQP
jgi:Trypsin-like peptidase domain